MALSEADKRSYTRRLMLSRMRILSRNGFYGLLLMHMIYNIDESCGTAATDGRRIFFGPGFLEELSDSELDFVMMHEIMHVVLQHCLRRGDRDADVFNIACDIVVNSNIMLSCGGDPKSITLRKYGESMHIAPDGKEGHEYTAEEVYEMLNKSGENPDQKNNGSGRGNGIPQKGGGNGKGQGAKNSKTTDAANAANSSDGADDADPAGNGGHGWDDHNRWGTAEDNELLRDLWVRRFEDACAAISIRESEKGRGKLPVFAERMLRELHKSRIDWRTVLNDFVQEEVVDYSFMPPDRRYDDSGFFLPDFNDTEQTVRDILFMIDTSGSMSDQEVSEAYAEICSAVEQFGGKLRGWLGFFDAAVIEPKPFDDIRELKNIRAAGGGGTDFGIIFMYVDKFMSDNPPVSIVIMTDGYAPFPPETVAMGIPVLWLINNEDITPPWGRIARICD